ncbi:FG-GAP repeat protein [Streptomyces sp. CAU 1734]|uniref:FG-GAP and VCBS repeat-containing protein n=1 Tax=Streptomyces sp. CAU 1734 TaxID=3140360 RepID=UPI0032613C67
MTVAASVLALVLSTAPPLTPQAAAAAGCAGAESDFNGDGIRDTVIADPEATVGTHQRAGKVTIVHGGGKGVLELTQDSPGIPGGPEADDQYGYALAVYDADSDGCSDLAIGAPHEDLGTSADAGLVHIVYGSTTGLNTGRAAKEHLQGASGTLAGGAEPGDWTGYALAAGETASGTPYLLIGSPGESLGTVEDAGAFFYIRGTAQTVVHVNQGTDAGGAVPGDVEVNDRFGASLAASPTHFAVGTPGEALGTTTFAGGVAVFSHEQVAGHPKPLAGLGQDNPDISGSEEQGDGFGTSLAMVPYRPLPIVPAGSLLAVGVPGEDLSTTVDAGAVQIFHISSAGEVTEREWVDQNTTDVEQESEAGDFFGQRLAAVGLTAGGLPSSRAFRLAIGVPGKQSSDEHRDTGGVHIVPMVGPPGAADNWIEPGNGIPGTPAKGRLAGMSLGATPDSLWVGMPYGPVEGHAVHAFSWNVATGGAPTSTLRPGEGGIPAGSTAFGAVVR